MNSALLVVRLILGGFLAAHGAQKLLGWFGGHGLGGTGGFMESLGFKPGKLFALAAGLCEGGGGLLVLLGFLNPIGPALIVIAMVTAMGSVHWKNGLFATSNGIELVAAWATCALAVAFTGPGIYSLDRLLRIAFATPWVTRWIVLGGVVIGLLNLLVRRPPPPAEKKA